MDVNLDRETLPLCSPEKDVVINIDSTWDSRSSSSSSSKYYDTFEKEPDQSFRKCEPRDSMDQLGLSTIEARKRLVSILMDVLQEYQSNAESKSHNSSSFKSIWNTRGVISLLCLCALFRTIALLVVVQSQHLFSEIIEVVVLLISAGSHLGLDTLQSQRQQKEALERIQCVVESIQEQLKLEKHEPLSGNTSSQRERVILSPTPTLIAVYRDSIWQRVSKNLLVAGDIIALMSGDLAPGEIELLENRSITFQPHETISNLDILDTAAASSKKKRTTATFDDPECLLSLCGDMRIFEMKDTPAVNDIDKSFEKMMNRPTTQLRKQSECCFHILQRIGLYCVILCILVLVLRTIVFRPAKARYLEHFLFIPVNIVLCFLPMSAPFVFFIAEIVATSRLMAVFEIILHPNRKTQTSKSTIYIPTTNHFDDLDVEERQDVRSKMALRFTYSRSWLYFFTTLKYRLSRCPQAHRSTEDHRANAENDDDAEENYALEPIPYGSMQLLERLGAVTMLCCVDDDVLCEPTPSVEEIFLLTDAQTKTKVLDVHHDFESDTGLKFEDPKWRNYLSLLKPIGLNILVGNSSLGSNFESKQYYLEWMESSSAASRRSEEQHALFKCKQRLSAHIRQLPEPEYLLNLSREIGFQSKDLVSFRKRQLIHILAPHLAHEEHTADTHAQGQEETRFRGNLKSHLLSNVILDRRSSGYQVLSRGDPTLALKHSSQYWNGASICPLGRSTHHTIMELYQQWNAEDLDCIAFTYAPIPPKLCSEFDHDSSHDGSSESILPPVYLVEGDRPSSSSGRFRSLEPEDHAEDHDANDHDDASTFLWHVQEDQIFLGMIATGVQPKKGVVGFIEDLMASGIRFSYFSPRNMRRSKNLAEKMGLETDWNCAISLRSLENDDEPDPHRMTSNYSDWDVKAKLPHGIAAIRRHLEQVDNVPLLVSLFTDSTTETIDEMIQIFQQNDEVVLCVGTSLNASNAFLFSRADVAIAMDSKVDTLFHEPLPSATEMHVLNESDILLSRVLNTFTCALSMGNDAKSSPNSMPLVDLIRVGREMLANHRQQLVFVVVAQLFLACVTLLGQMLPCPQPSEISGLWLVYYLWIVIPAMSLTMISSASTPEVMTETPSKNDFNGVFLEPLAFGGKLALRILPSAGVCVVVYQLILGYSQQRDDDGESVLESRSMATYVFDTPVYQELPRSPTVLVAIDRAQVIMSFYMTLCLVVLSANVMYRAESTLTVSPLRNTSWVLTCLMLVLVQLIQGLLVHPPALLDFLGSTPYMLWLALGFSLVITFGLDELVKYHDRKILRRWHKFLRMQFDTRLGMWSPK